MTGQTAQAKAAYEEQVADYRNAVLTAYQDVEDNLAALRQLEVESETDAAAVQATNTALEQAQAALQARASSLTSKWRARKPRRCRRSSPP